MLRTILTILMIVQIVGCSVVNEKKTSENKLDHQDDLLIIHESKSQIENELQNTEAQDYFTVEIDTLKFMIPSTYNEKIIEKNVAVAYQYKGEECVVTVSKILGEGVSIPDAASMLEQRFIDDPFQSREIKVSKMDSQFGPYKSNTILVQVAGFQLTQDLFILESDEGVSYLMLVQDMLTDSGEHTSEYDLLKSKLIESIRFEN